jgi:hypothetical protein
MDATIKCRYCQRSIEAQDLYCRYCGKGQNTSIPFRYTHAGIIVFTLLFGPVALPFIWKSPKIGQKGRIVYLLINLLVTVCMISFLIGIYGSINRQMQETMKILEQTGIGGK